MSEFYIEFHFFFLKICLQLFKKILEKYENLVLVTASLDTHCAKEKTKNFAIFFFLIWNVFFRKRLKRNNHT